MWLLQEKSALEGKSVTLLDMSLELPPLHVHVLALQALQLQKNLTVLEMGCGVGYLLALASYITESTEVSGIDVNPSP